MGVIRQKGRGYGHIVIASKAEIEDAIRYFNGELKISELLKNSGCKIAKTSLSALHSRAATVVKGLIKRGVLERIKKTD